MAAKLPPAQHEVMAHFAWELSLRGSNVPAIVKKIATEFDRTIDESTVDRMLKEQRELVKEQVASMREDALAQFLSEQRAIYTDSYRKARAQGMKPTEALGFLRLAQRASVDMGKVFGLFIEQFALADEPETFTRIYVGVEDDWL